MIGHSRFGLSLGRYFGIRFYLDYSWFLIASITVYELAANLFPPALPGHSHLLYFGMALVTAFAFFFSILLHELGHSLVSQRCGIPVPRITLLFIGGIAEISREPDSASAEFRIAIAGPAVSVVLAILYGTGALIAEFRHWDAVSVICQWLAFVNISLVAFNCIPGYPLDGGRILRALIWGRTRNLRKATFITTRIGVGAGWLLVALGIFLLYQGVWNAFVFILIGIFLKGAAETGYANTLYHEVLAGVPVSEIMTRDPICIPAHTPLSMAVDEFFLAKHHVAFPVIGDDRDFRGLLRLDHLKTVAREKWPYTTAADLTAATDSTAASIDIAEDAERAMRRISAGEGRLAVLDHAKVAGILTRHDILHFITIHTELNSGGAAKVG